CHVCGNCCREYVVTITDEERRRIEGQGWGREPDFAGVPLFRRSGWWGFRKWELNRRPDGACVFLGEGGRCRIHERFGPEGKPLPCRLYPFILVPAGEGWRVGLRFACPSVLASKGRPALEAHGDDLRRFAGVLAAREGLGRGGQPGGSRELLPPPPLQGRQRVSWPDLFRFTAALGKLVRDRRDRVERRLRKCLALADLCRQARFDKVQGGRLSEFLDILSANLDADVPADPAALPPPGWVGRVLFRQALAVFARKDQGPNRGLSRQGRVALLRAAARFARGTGPVPRVHAGLPGVTFEQAEAPAGPLPEAAELLLERYYAVKIESLQFCGARYFGVSFWDGLETLVLTLPLVLWLRRAFAGQPAEEAVARGLAMVDDHFGFNPVLGSARQRLSFRILAHGGELAKLVAWYAR
ncbi:MAG TPA: YkgJ family cysteine cluster protein, partial [Gemmataceae bacterium]|nr:YkgJ family cysteine cluster protein [Gemmataceae bacterium]